MKNTQRIEETRKQIKQYQKHIQERQAGIQELEERIVTLEGVLYQYQGIQQRVGEFYGNMNSRSSGLIEAYPHSKFASSFGNHLQERNSGQHALQAIMKTDERMQRIGNKMQEYQEEIEVMKRDIHRYTNYIEDLQYQIKRLLEQEEDV